MTIAVLTGAGISTASGIPDYRGPAGLWRQDPDHEKLVTYRYYVSDPDIRRRSWLMRDANPAWTAQPNDAHRALATVPRSWVITQNVDGLHQRGGSPADRVLELHGTMFETVCIGCGDRASTRAALERLHAGDADPSCLLCGDLLKTATVMFGQALDDTVLATAFDVARRASVFLAIGSSLQVQPAASLVAVAAEAGARVIIVNAEPTPYDDVAEEMIREPIAQAVPALVRRLADRFQ